MPGTVPSVKSRAIPRLIATGGFGNATDRSFYHNGGQNNVRSVADWSGTQVAGYTYDAWGSVRWQTGSATNLFGYDGQQQDFTSGLFFLRARYYDPLSGRFTQQDPTESGVNWYTYTGDTPVNATDPCGLCDDMHWMAGAYTDYVLQGSDLSVLGFWYSQAAKGEGALQQAFKGNLAQWVIGVITGWAFRRLAIAGLFGAAAGANAGPIGSILGFLAGVAYSAYSQYRANADTEVAGRFSLYSQRTVEIRQEPTLGGGFTLTISDRGWGRHELYTIHGATDLLKIMKASGLACRQHFFNSNMINDFFSLSYFTGQHTASGGRAKYD